MASWSLEDYKEKRPKDIMVEDSTTMGSSDSTAMEKFVSI